MRTPTQRTLFIALTLLVQVLAIGCNGQPSSGGYPLGTLPGGNTAVVPPDAEESSFVALINRYRMQNGLSGLQISITLTQSSQWMSKDMAAGNYLDHTDSLGRDPFVRMAAFGYTQANYSGENIAAGNSSAQDTFNQWKNSPAHNANMLDSAYAVLGVGRVYDVSSNYGWYWTTDFGSSIQ